MFRIPTKIPLILAFIIIILSSSLWYLDYYADRERIKEAHADFTDNAAVVLSNQIQDHIELIEDVLSLNIIEFIETGSIGQPQFERIVQPFYDFLTGYRAINLINATGHIINVYPRVSNTAVINQSIVTFADGSSNQYFAEAKEENTTRVSNLIWLYQGGNGIASYIPVTTNNAVSYFLNVVLDVEFIIKSWLESDEQSASYLIRLEDNGDIVYSSNEFDDDSEYILNDTIEFYNQEWALHTTLSPSVVSQISLLSNSYIAIIGIFFALFAGFSAQLLIRQNDLQQERFEEQQQYEKLINQYEKINALGTMAGGLAHDFNNLLMSISGNISILKYLLEDTTNKEISETIESIESIIEQSKDLTQQILIFSRQSEINSERVDIAKTLQDTLKIFESARSKTIDVSTNFQHGRSITAANKSRLSQCFLNLLNNAEDAIEGSGYIEINTYSISNIENMPDTLKTLAKMDSIKSFFQIDIIDSGTGIEEQLIDRIFDPFFTTKETGKGTGLGLAIVYQYITSIGGEIIVKSNMGFGSRFSIFIPIREPDLSTVSQSQSEEIRSLDQLLADFEKNSGRRLTAMLIEDEKEIAKSIARMLNEVEINSIVSHHGTEAIDLFEEKLRETPIDLMITDINLPGKSGIEVAKILRKKVPSLPLIFITGFNEERLSTIDIGDFEFLQKPFGREDLYGKIKVILNRIVN